MANNELAHPMFAFRFAKEDPQSQIPEAGGSFTIGGVDHSQFEGPMEYYSVNRGSGVWQIPLTGLKVNGVAIPLGSSGANWATLDSALPCLYGPTHVVQDLYAKVPGAQEVSAGSGNYIYTVPCNTVIKLSLSFGGGRDWSIPPDGAKLTESGICVGVIVGNDRVGGWAVGAPLLSAVYSAYIVSDRPHVGFASLS